MAEKGEKRSISEAEDVQSDIKVLLLDIEGTTTPITFVTDVLFGYVKKNLKSYLETHIGEQECNDDIKALQEQITDDKKAKLEDVPEIPTLADDNKEAVVQATVDNVTWQMQSDRKTTALKQLQGHIWRHAYSSGEVKGRVFQDAVDFLKAWISDGKKAYIYSSGSVEAQKLLFCHSEHGDLTKYLSGHFDTKVGPKREKESYMKILKEINCNSSEVLFLTDIPAEAKAATEAGMKAFIVTREGNAKLLEEDKKNFNIISSFNELDSNNTETIQNKK